MAKLCSPPHEEAGERDPEVALSAPLFPQVAESHIRTDILIMPVCGFCIKCIGLPDGVCRNRHEIEYKAEPLVWHYAATFTKHCHVTVVCKAFWKQVQKTAGGRTCKSCSSDQQRKIQQ